MLLQEHRLHLGRALHPPQDCGFPRGKALPAVSTSISHTAHWHWEISPTTAQWPVDQRCINLGGHAF